MWKQYYFCYMGLIYAVINDNICSEYIIDMEWSDN